jgi:hypothetical protein
MLAQLYLFITPVEINRKQDYDHGVKMYIDKLDKFPCR